MLCRFACAGGSLPFFGSEISVKITGFECSEWLDAPFDLYRWGPVCIDWMKCAPEWQDEVDYMLQSTPALDVWPFGCLSVPSLLLLLA